jgi:alpha-tubulin suppressor-like RCC1 family protein
MPYEPTTNFRDSDGVDLGKKLVTKDYLLSVYETILESSGATGLVVTPELWTWGRNTNAQLGDNTTTDRSTPVTTFAGGTNWKQIARGSNHTAAIKTDGSLWTWGLNTLGQLGTNDANTRSTPVTTFAGGNDWKQVSSTSNSATSAAIKTDGSLWVWGLGTTGKLGNNAATNRSTPVTTFAGGNNWKQVSVGVQQVAAIKTDGSLWLWGNNNAAQLGVNDANIRSTPVTTFAGGNNWKYVACGANYVTAIKTDGSLWTWGLNINGELGVNDILIKSTPVTTFAGGNDWKQVFCGQFHTTAIKTDGSLWTWGAGTVGQLGTNDITTRSTPVTTFAGGTNWKQVSAGINHTEAIKTDGSLWTWGHGVNGLIGDNRLVIRSTPVTTFAGGNNWKSVAGGGYSIAAIQSNDYI